jgi:Flp pilus assembly protein TadD
VLDKDDENEKALYRRGVCYLEIGEMNKAKHDLLKANQLSGGKDTAINEALKRL